MKNSISVESKSRLSEENELLYEELKADIMAVRFDHDYSSPLHFLSFLTDKELLKQLYLIKKQKDSPNLKKIFIVSIGGANLGAKAIMNAYGSNYAREFIFVDTVYPGETEDLRRHIEGTNKLDEFLLIIISKSGETLEILTNAKLLQSLLEEKFELIDSQMIVVSVEDTPLFSETKARDITCVSIPDTISDRYAVFSAVGLMPLLFTDFSIEEFVRGGLHSLDEFIHNGSVMKIAELLNKTFPDGVHGILDFFMFSKRLETFGKWNRQLFAESLGKETTIDGEALNRSITPTVSVGTTDLHSMLQLYLAQPQERATWFFSLTEEDSLKDKKSPEFLLSVIYKNIVNEFREHNIPFVESYMDTISGESLGFHMMNSFLTVISLARLWNVNPFDQPNVEEYKMESKLML